MVGILGSRRPSAFLPMQDDQMADPASRWGADSPPSVLGAIGDAAGADPSARAGLTDSQRHRLMFAGLADAFDSLQGREGNTSASLSAGFDQQNEKQAQSARRLQINKSIAAAYGSGDMNAVRQALMNADPADVAHITSALSFGQPKVQDIGGAGYTQDPITGTLTQAVPARPKAPIINNGLMSADNGTTWTAIPGYVAQQQAIAGARRAPPKPAAPKSTFGNPASLFGGR